MSPRAPLTAASMLVGRSTGSMRLSVLLQKSKLASSLSVQTLPSRTLSYSSTWRETEEDAAEKDPLQPPDPASYLRGFDEVPQTALYKDAILGACHLQPGDKVLDIGCGTATHIPRYAESVGREGHTTGIDISPSVIERASETYQHVLSNVDFQVASVYDLPFEASTFDVVKEDRVLEHLVRPLEAAQEMLRVTKPGGTLVVANPDFRSFTMDLPSQRWGDRRRPLVEVDAYALMTKLLNGVVPTLCSHPSIGLQMPRLLRAAGCSDIELQVVPVPLIGLENLEKVVPISYMTRISESNGAISPEEMTAALEFLKGQGESLLGMMNMYICRGVKPGDVTVDRPAIGQPFWAGKRQPPPKHDVHIRLATPDDDPELIEEARALVNNEYATSDTGVTLSSTRLRPKDIEYMAKNKELLLAFDPATGDLMGCVQVKLGGGLPTEDGEMVGEFTCLAVVSDVTAVVSNVYTQDVAIERTVKKGASRRGRGIGAALVRKAEAVARENGATRMLIGIMCPAHGEEPVYKQWLRGYYQSLGYDYKETIVFGFEKDEAGKVVVDEVHQSYEPLHQLVQCKGILYDKEL